MELIYIGDKFYYGSSTMMSSIYTVEGIRSDWNQVSRVLELGESVHIRPAIESEIAFYKQKLKEVKKSLCAEED